MQEHAENLRSQPKPKCPECGRGTEKTETVCRKCGADLTDREAATDTVYDTAKSAD